MFPLLYFKDLDKLDMEVWVFWLFKVLSILSSFQLGVSNMQESCTHIFSNSNCSLIKFLAILCSIYFSVVAVIFK